MEKKGADIKRILRKFGYPPTSKPRPSSWCFNRPRPFAARNGRRRTGNAFTDTLSVKMGNVDEPREALLLLGSAIALAVQQADHAVEPAEGCPGLG